MDIIPYYVYIVECADHTLYTGVTTDVLDRVRTHNTGQGARYTRSRLPVTLRYQEMHPDKGAALKREYALKQYTRTDKLALIAKGANSPTEA